MITPMIPTRIWGELAEQGREHEGERGRPRHHDHERKARLQRRREREIAKQGRDKQRCEKCRGPSHRFGEDQGQRDADAESQQPMPAYDRSPIALVGRAGPGHGYRR